MYSKGCILALEAFTRKMNTNKAAPIITGMTVIPQQHALFRFHFYQSSANSLKNVKSSKKYQDRNVAYFVRFL